MKLFIISIISFLVTIPLFANGQITGIVVDKNRQPVEFAQIIALDRDSIIINNTQTDERGHFKLEENGVAMLNISAFGFESQSFAMINRIGEMDTIKLLPTSINLKEVIVSASVPTTKLSGGALVTNVANSYLSQLGTANDVLGWIPMITGSDGNFTVFGKGKPLIYINGRKVVNNSELEQLSSKNIKDIKILSNPGAKYDASVKAVIVIQTKKPKGEGLGLNIRTKGSFANYFSPLGQLDLTYRIGGLDLSVVSYLAHSKKRYDSFFNQETYLSSIIKESLSQTAINKQTEYIEKFTVNYMISPNHSVGGYYRLILNDSKISISSTNDVSKDGILWDEVIENGTNKKNLYATHNSNVYYNGSLGAWELDLNMDYYSSNPTTQSNHQESSLNWGNRHITSRSETDSKLLAHKASIAYNFNTVRLELGEEYTNSKMKMDYYNPENILPSSSNTVKENNQALFVEYTQMMGGLFQLDAGLRYEHINYHYSSSDNKTKKTYNNIFPSLGISAQLGNLSMSLSYSNKTKRPTYSQLDGNLRYDNRYQYQKGNPELKPVRTEVLEFIAQYQPVFFHVSYQNQRHPILSNAEPYNTDEDITIISYINGPSIKEFDAMAGVSVDKSSWNLQISGGIAKQWFKTIFNSNPISLGKPIGIVKLNGYVKLPFGVKLMCDYTFQTRGNMQNTFVYSHSILDLALYKTFCKGKIDIRIAGKDLLNKSMDRAKLYSGNIFINTQEKFDQRACEVTFRYHLNVPKNKYKGKGAGLAEKERM